MQKMKLSFHARLDWTWSMIKTRQDNNMTDHTGVVYTENKTELLLPIRSKAVCDENQTT